MAERIKLWFPIVLVAVIAIGFLVKQKAENDALDRLEFRGTVVKEQRLPSGPMASDDTSGRITLHSAHRVAITIKQDNGELYSWYVPEISAGYYLKGDYLIKLPGRDLPAVFRKGKQIKGTPYYLDEDVSRD